MTSIAQAPRALRISRRFFWLLALGFLLVVHLALRGANADRDAHAYLDWYRRLADVPFDEVQARWSWYPAVVAPYVYEWAFTLLGWVLRAQEASAAMFFGVVAAISIGLKVGPLRRHCPTPVLALLWYVSSSYLLLEMNAMRAGIAAGFLLLAVGAMLERKHWLFLLLVALSVSFHVSAAIGLLFPLIRSERLSPRVMALLLAASIPLGYMNAATWLHHVGDVIPKVQEYLDLLAYEGKYEDINRFNTLSVVRVAISGVLLWNFRKLSGNPATAFGIRSFVVAQATYFAFASVPVVGSRVSQLMAVLEVLAVPAITLLRPRLFWLATFLSICALQLYILSVHFQLADFFYFVGEPRVTDVDP